MLEAKRKIKDAWHICVAISSENASPVEELVASTDQCVEILWDTEDVL